MFSSADLCEIFVPHRETLNKFNHTFFSLRGDLLTPKEFFKVSTSSVSVIVLIVSIASFISAVTSYSQLLKIPFLILVGYLSSSSAVLINNLYDADLDEKMERTKYRPSLVTPNRIILSITSAAFIIAASLLSLFFLSIYSLGFFLAGYSIYSFLYTMLLKRRTQANIIIGGTAASFVCFAGWSAVSSPFNIEPLYFAIFIFLWMILHFWSFSVVHTEDYKKTGIPMLPIVGKSSNASISIFTISILLAILAYLPVYFFAHITTFPYIAVYALMDGILLYLSYIPLRKSSQWEPYKAMLNYSNVYLIIMIFILGGINLVQMNLVGGVP